jgi:Kef-type K+ transport system membrane component KefB
MGSVFIILMGAVICGYIAKALKQPQMVGYMMMGVIV